MARGTLLKSQQAHDSIVEWIRCGKFKPGDRLPSEKKIAELLHMSHVSVRRGMEMLRKAGVIEKRHRVGNFVSAIHPEKLAIQVAVAVPAWLMEGTTQHPTFSLLMDGLREKLHQREYSMVNLVYKPGCFWSDVGQIIKKRGINAMVLFPEESVSRDDVKRLLENGLKMVLATPCKALQGLGLFSVTWDRARVASSICDHLLALGHRDVVVVGYEHGKPPCELDIFRVYHETRGLGIGDDYYLDLPNNPERDPSVLESIFTRKHLPTAVIVPDEVTANDIFRLCYRRNLRVPEDMSIAALVDMTPHSHPVELTAPDTVSLHRRIFQILGQRLTDLLDDKPLLEQEIVLRSEVLWKESTGAPRRRDPSPTREHPRSHPPPQRQKQVPHRV